MTAASPNSLPTHLSDVQPWSKSRRDTQDTAHIAALKGSIAAKGVLYPPILRRTRTPGVSQPFELIAGHNRWQAILELVAEGTLPDDYMPPLRVLDLDDREALDVAVTENVVRLNLHPIEEARRFHDLVASGVSPRSLANAYGKTERFIAGRLALARLVPDLAQLVVDEKRPLAWAQQAALADIGLQKTIANDISVHPAAWPDVASIKRHLTAGAIPFSNALFDVSHYTGPIYDDLFADDNTRAFQDHAQFWDLQNAAIDRLAQSHRDAGWASVTVIRDAVFEDWRYAACDDRTTGGVWIEVAPTGAVTEYVGYVARFQDCADEQDADADGLFADTDDDLPDDADQDTLALAARAPLPIDPTDPSGLVTLSAPTDTDDTGDKPEYIAAQKSAMLQVAIANDGNGHGDRAARVCVILALLADNPCSTIRGLAFAMPGSEEDHTGPAFGDLLATRRTLANLLDTHGLGTTEARRSTGLTTLLALPDDDLNAIFRSLVALRVGIKAKPSEEADTLARHLAHLLDINPSEHWRPDEPYLRRKTAARLRGLISRLLPPERQAGMTTASKSHLLRMLLDGFRDAATDAATLPAAFRARLNTFLPDALRF